MSAALDALGVVTVRAGLLARAAETLPAVARAVSALLARPFPERALREPVVESHEGGFGRPSFAMAVF
jgi:hypothetical protein